MCMAFVKYGKDYICGFNMDINVEAMDWKLLMDENRFAVALPMTNPADYAPKGTHIPPEYTDSEGGVLRIHGVNRNGCFAGQLNNMKDFIIRLEKKEDYRATENLIREAFWNVYRPGCSEHYVMHVLRDDPAFIPELDFVMEQDSARDGCMTRRG